MMDDDVDMGLLNMPDEKLEFKDWIHKRYLQFFVANNGSVSKRDYALRLGISDSNLVNYMAGHRKPNPAMVERLADNPLIGPVIYDKLGLPRKMPRNKLLLFVVDNLPKLTETDQKEIVERIKNKIAERAQGTSTGPVRPAD